MRSIGTFAAPVAFVAILAAAATPASAQGLGFDIGEPRSKTSSGYYYRQSPHQKDGPATNAPKPFLGLGPYDYLPQGVPSTDGADDCYTRSLSGRICID